MLASLWGWMKYCSSQIHSDIQHVIICELLIVFLIRWRLEAVWPATQNPSALTFKDNVRVILLYLWSPTNTTHLTTQHHRPARSMKASPLSCISLASDAWRRFHFVGGTRHTSRVWLCCSDETVVNRGQTAKSLWKETLTSSIFLRHRYE